MRKKEQFNKENRANELQKKALIRKEKALEKQRILEQKRGYILSIFNPIEGGETTFYYLRLLFRGKKYYKVGVTLHSVTARYNKKDFEIINKILYEKKLTHANTIEKQIIEKYKNKVFPLSILSSGESEIFDEDILKLDD